MGLRNPAPATPHVALIVTSAFGYGRELLEGISQYVREYGPWLLYFDPRNSPDEIPGWLRRWKGNGIIGRLQVPAIADAAIRTGLPVVDTVGELSRSGVPTVRLDDEAIGRLAADHFLERGFRSFGCCSYCEEEGKVEGETRKVEGGRRKAEGVDGIEARYRARRGKTPGKNPHPSPLPGGEGTRGVIADKLIWSRERGDAFVQRVEAPGYPCSVHRLQHSPLTGNAWEQEQGRLARWVAQLPKPAGIFAVNDNMGKRVLEACQRAGVAVPEQMAVVGVDNDSLVCGLCTPPLSSVAADHFRVGYEAAKLLDELMRGEPLPESLLKIPPRGVVTRLSSDVLAIDDPEVAQAVREIREHACEGIDVAEVAQRVGLSRTTLKRHFQAILKRSVFDEIVAVQLKRAQELLADTDLPLKLIARRTGFRHASSMAAAFKSRTGITPGEYRAEKARKN